MAKAFYDTASHKSAFDENVYRGINLYKFRHSADLQETVQQSTYSMPSLVVLFHFIEILSKNISYR